uniref:zinc finger protein 135-like n=1 Tax=Euleptes europaea TaxID=460621 RepID=UPI00254192CD|nr:zinc finger protein 135-like [Euleptes europaea]
MAGGGACQVQVRFEDVMVHISMEELQMLEKWQQELYFEVLKENYESLIAIGSPATSSEVIAWFKGGGWQNRAESQDPRRGDSSASENEEAFGSGSGSQNLLICTQTDGGLGQIYSKQYTETLGPPKMVDSRFEEELAQEGDLEGPPKLLGVPLMQRGNPVRDECVPHPEKATHGLASPTHSQVAAVVLKPYICRWCGETFRLKGLLRIHNRVSLQKPSLPCPDCGVCFLSSWHLKRHQRIHSRACVDSPGTGQGSRAEERLLFCADCGEGFRRYLDFLQHQKTHEEAKVWPCARCNTTFTHQSDLVMHEESHFEEELCTYAPCGENCVCALSVPLHFASRFEKSTENSKTHLQKDEKPHGDVKSEPEKPYSCHQCGEKFRLEGNLQLHYRYCHKQRLQKYRYGVTSPERPKDRDKWVPNGEVPEASRDSSGPPSQTSSARWTCSLCKKGFNSRYSLGKHRQRHKAEQHQSAAEPDKNAGPASGFGSRAAVGITKKLHKCQECGKRFVYKRHLVTHMKAHAKESRHWGPLCGESLGYKGSVRKPILIHLGEEPPSGGRQEDSSPPAVATEQRKEKKRRRQEEELSQCTECGKSLSKSYLHSHQAWHAGRRYRCRLCGIVFNFNSAGHRHLQQHRKNGDFSTCPQCGNRRRSKCCLCLLETIHLGQKPLPPTEDPCGKRPASHKQGVHSGMQPGKEGESEESPAAGARIPYRSLPKPFRCMECGKRFAYKARLIMHRRSHTGELPFQCAECGKGFIHKSYLNLHKKMHVKKVGVREGGAGSVACTKGMQMGLVTEGWGEQ